MGREVTQDERREPYQDLSLISLISNASVLVKLVLALLLAFTDFLVVHLSQGLRVATTPHRTVRAQLLERRRPGSLFQASSGSRRPSGSMERIFEAGFREFVKLRKQTIGGPSVMDGTRRAMRATYQREMDYSRRTSRFSRPSARSVPTSGCSARSGGS